MGARHQTSVLEVRGTVTATSTYHSLPDTVAVGDGRRLLVSRMANDVAANGMNLLQHGAVGPQTRLNYAASLLKFESWLELRGEKHRDRRRNRCRNAHLDGKRVHERESGELRRTVAQCLDGQVPVVRQTRCSQIAEDLEEPPGLAAPLTLSLAETLGACSMVRDRVQTGGARPAFYFFGTVGDVGAPFLCSARDSATWCLHFAGPCRISQSSWQPKKQSDQRRYERSTIHSSWTVPWLENSSPSGRPSEAKGRKNRCGP